MAGIVSRTVGEASAVPLPSPTLGTNREELAHRGTPHQRPDDILEPAVAVRHDNKRGSSTNRRAGHRLESRVVARVTDDVSHSGMSLDGPAEAPRQRVCEVYLWAEHLAKRGGAQAVRVHGFGVDDFNQKVRIVVHCRMQGSG